MIYVFFVVGAIICSSCIFWTVKFYNNWRDSEYWTGSFAIGLAFAWFLPIVSLSYLALSKDKETCFTILATTSTILCIAYLIIGGVLLAPLF